MNEETAETNNDHIDKPSAWDWLKSKLNFKKQDNVASAQSPDSAPLAPYKIERSEPTRFEQDNLNKELTQSNKF
jgi:hypothetical protein